MRNICELHARNGSPGRVPVHFLPTLVSAPSACSRPPSPPPPPQVHNPNYQYKPTTFFCDQLTSFEIWIEFGTEKDPPPDQMPCIIQGLSSQQHRLHALELLAKYLDLGPWAVNDALACGIMPYVMKFLAHPELLYMLVAIWVKVCALENSRGRGTQKARHGGSGGDWNCEKCAVILPHRNGFDRWGLVFLDRHGTPCHSIQGCALGMRYCFSFFCWR